jgi:signal transduction histidine kinase
MTQRVTHRWVLEYVAATLAVGLALAVTAPLPALARAPTPLFFAAVMASAWYGGLGAGLFATTLSALALDYWFLPPLHSLDMGVAETVHLLVFVAVAVLTSSLNAVRHQLEAVLRLQDRCRDEFLTVLAHELGHPLAAVSDALAVLRRRGTDAAAERVLGGVQRQVGTMHRFVEELFDVAAVRRGKLRLLKTVVDVHTAVTQAAETVRPLMAARAHRLTVQLADEPVYLEADPLRLEQILIDLLAHAARYTEPGGDIRLTFGREGDTAVLTVRDNGLGFTPASMAHVFDLFTGDAASGCGPGFGLYLVRELVRLHDGAVAAHSDGLNRGSAFIVRLPGALSAHPAGSADACDALREPARAA